MKEKKNLRCENLREFNKKLHMESFLKPRVSNTTWLFWDLNPACVGFSAPTLVIIKAPVAKGFSAHSLVFPYLHPVLRETFQVCLCFLLRVSSAQCTDN